MLAILRNHLEKKCQNAIGPTPDKLVSQKLYHSHYNSKPHITFHQDVTNVTIHFFIFKTMYNH